ncbi:MAG TPA: NAD(P)-dependent oxidoreductase [Saprospirales bacterium]|nr:NAD(P)-dependent oxidoreductase [Saprospirales bacterium]
MEVKNILEEAVQETIFSSPQSGQNIQEASPSVQTHLPKSAELVLITGATSGIGKATAEIFAKNGYRLILTGRRIDRLVALKNQFESSYNSEVLILPFDVRDHGAVEAALSNLPEGFNIVDILINNAGLAKGLAPIHEGQLDHWETMIDTNIKGLLYVTRLISPGMVKRRKGHIINICSSAGREAYPNGNVYCATKFAVDALTKSIRFDLHPYDIRVSQVSPGHVEETEFALNRFDGDTERAKIYQEFQPLKSSDVAEAIYFMATRPAYVNIVDIQMFATQQASSMVINKDGRRFE